MMQNRLRLIGGFALPHRAFGVFLGAALLVATTVSTSPVSADENALAEKVISELRDGHLDEASVILRGINSPAIRQAVISQANHLAASRSSESSGSSDHDPFEGAFQGGGQVSGTGSGAQGGGAFADFDSLMNLIETTVVPDTWEALGGNSTMAPYPQGVYVDSSGMLRDVPDKIDSDAIGNLKTLLADDPETLERDWKQSSPLRCVSLRRLRDELGRLRLAAVAPTLDVRFLAGLSEIRFIVLTEDDVILAGPVGGIEMHKGWWVDRKTGHAVMRSDFLARAIAGAFSQTPFGCTIDPTVEGLRSAMAVGAKVNQNEVPIGKAADAMVTALGAQRVEVFGTAGDTPAALLMIEADRHMKELALEKHPMPESVPNYLDCIDQFIDSGAPNDLLLRLWFTAKPQKLRSDGEGTVFQLGGNPMRLSGENQRALKTGLRGDITVDPRSQAFVDAFNQHFGSIRDHYPIYGGLESLYRAAAVAEVIRRHGTENVHHLLAEGFANEDELRDWIMHPAKSVRSIAALHTVRKGSKRHHILIASGGVSISAQAAVDSETISYPSLVSYRGAEKYRPSEFKQWWWDVRKNNR
ncbi:MAG: DUF1598 domain-containing protein [Planctomycetota bacterium]